jgi:hypothetical protein
LLDGQVVLRMRPTTTQAQLLKLMDEFSWMVITASKIEGASDGAVGLRKSEVDFITGTSSVEELYP